MIAAARHLLAFLIVFALVGGPAVSHAHAAHTAPQAMAADVPCDMDRPAADNDHGEPTAPCKGMQSDCMKQMCCAAIAVLPAPLDNGEYGAPFSTVSYWSAWSSLAGMTRIPEPLPPRTI